MKRVFALILWAVAGFGAVAQTTAETQGEDVEPPLTVEAVEISLNDFLWQKRPVIVFADSPADPAFRRQIDLLSARQVALDARDVVVIVDTDPAARSDLRLKLRPRGFMLALIGKDGQVKLRKPLPWDVRELTRVIDKMPMRRQEIRDRKANGGNLGG